MARQKHKILQEGTIFESNKGEKVEVLEYSHFENGNYYYDCLNLETAEAKIIQYSNLKSGNFTFQARYTYSDRQLYFVLRRAYDHIVERLKYRKSYADVQNRFETFEAFYNFFILYFEENPHLYDDFINGKLEIDKDLLSEFYIKNGKLEMKEYSRDTILLVTKNENNSEIRKAIHSGDTHRIEQLIQEIFRRRKEKRPNAGTFSL
jgi:hypothetical protein